MGQPLVNALLAERYGTKWLGEIKALASPLNVFSSALSPAVMGILFDRGDSLHLVLGLLLTLSCFSFIMPLIWFNLLRRLSLRPWLFIQPANHPVHSVKHPPDKQGYHRHASCLKDRYIRWQMTVWQQFDQIADQPHSIIGTSNNR